MTSQAFVQTINTEAIALWVEQYHDRLDQEPAPLIYDKIESDGLLFVGCNPASPKKNHYHAPKLAELVGNPKAIFELMDEERQARDSYPYFKPCQEIAKRLEMKWTHVDWFFKRDTSQGTLADEVTEDRGQGKSGIKLNAFARRQVALSRRLIDACRPRMVLVMNGFASRIARSEFNLVELDDEGLQWAEIGGRRVPIFLSGMLSGQRALDHGSRERLEWHMVRAKALTPKSDCSSQQRLHEERGRLDRDRQPRPA